jgi:hypothetical protein
MLRFRVCKGIYKVLQVIQSTVQFIQHGHGAPLSFVVQEYMSLRFPNHTIAEEFQKAIFAM